MIVRVSKAKTAYTIVDNRPALDERLGSSAVGVMFYLLTKPDNWSVRIDDLRARFRDLGRDAARKVLRELEQAGYAALSPVRDQNGKLIGKEWVIYEAPGTVDDHRTTESQAFGCSTEVTESLKVRLSGDIVNTDGVINTDVSIREKGPASLFDDFDGISPPPVAPPPPSKRPRKGALSNRLEESFEEAYGGADGRARFLCSFSGTDYELADLEYYYQVVSNWAASKGVRRKDWLATARTFMLRDVSDNKLRLKPSSNSHANGNATSQKRSGATGVDLDQSRRVAEKLAARFSGKG